VTRDKMLAWAQRIFRGFEVDYNPIRNLLQIPPAKHGRPHVDIWVWHENPNDLGTMWSIERTTHKQFRSDKDTFPLTYVVWHALNISAAIPQDSHKLMLEEYGPNYLIPYYSRADCLHNFVHGRFAYRLWVDFVPSWMVEVVIDVSGVAVLFSTLAAIVVVAVVKVSVWILDDSSLKRSQ